MDDIPVFLPVLCIGFPTLPHWPKMLQHHEFCFVERLLRLEANSRPSSLRAPWDLLSLDWQNNKLAAAARFGEVNLAARHILGEHKVHLLNTDLSRGETEKIGLQLDGRLAFAKQTTLNVKSWSWRVERVVSIGRD